MAKRENATQSQKLMVFVLTMSLYGLATLFTELIPSIQVGIVEFWVYMPHQRFRALSHIVDRPEGEHRKDDAAQQQPHGAQEPGATAE